MAEPLDNEGTKSFSGTLVAGSEEDFDTLCEFCHGDGKRVEAAGYCVDCKEYLCQECKTIHKKTSATRKHVLQDNLDMSRKKDGAKQLPGSSDTTDPLTDRCQYHPDEFIKFYCNTHKKLGCSVCIPLHHRTCDDISYIRDVSSGIADSEEMKKIQADIKKLLAVLECSKSRSEWSQRETDDGYKQMVTEVKLFRRNINELLDKLEENLLKKASLLRKEQLDSLLDQTRKCDGLHDTLTEMNSDLENKLGQKRFNQSYISMKSAMEKMPVLENEVVGFGKTIRPRRFEFRRDDKLDGIISSITGLVTVSMDSKAEDLRATYLHDISIKSNADKRECNINCAAVLPGGRLALGDRDNKSVKLVDIVSRKLYEQISLPSAPSGLALIRNDQLAVTLNGETYIQLLSLSPTLSAIHMIAMPGKYNDITYNDGKLITACYKPAFSVHICDMSGKLLQQLNADETGNTLFCGTPLRITTSQDQSIIYVNCFKSNRTTCLNKAGVVMATYGNDRLKDPKGVTVDDYGSVYVCSQATHTVHQLTPDGQLIKIILEEKDGLKFPNAITHSDGKLYISNTSTTIVHRNNIKVYKLE